MNNKGFTITEVIVALVIFSVIAVPVSLIFTRISTNFKLSEKVIALSYLDGILEKITISNEEVYDMESEVVINKKVYRIVKTIEHKDLIHIKMQMFFNNRKLAELTGYKYIE